MILPVGRKSCLSLLLALAAAAAHADNFGFASLEALMRTHDAGTVEELLAALPEAQRRDYALIFDSRSLQAASFENPRVILYGPDARFVLTFNGAAAQTGFRVVETLEFDAASREFRLRELEFPERPGGAAAVHVSDANPERCTRCHGDPPRPLWDSFPLWPGAYGERYGASLADRERAGLARYFAQQAAHPRYRYLLDTVRYADPRTFRPGAGTQYSATVREPPNAELAADLDDLQFQAVAARLTRQPAFATYRYALLGVADGGCAPLSDFYPAALWRAERAAFERFARDTAQANALQAQRKAERAAQRMKALPAPAAIDTLLPLRFVAESALDMPTGAWTLALEAGTYDFTRPTAAPLPLRASLLAEIAPGDRALEPLSRSVTSADGDRYCSYLKRRSRAALEGAAGTAISTVARAPAALRAREPAADNRAAAPPAVLALCVSCHEADVGPRIHFSDPKLLTQQLGDRAAHGTLYDEIRFRLSAGAGARRMPLGLNLADADRRALEAYFGALARSAN